ncbi:outer membrane protein with beta-barrel domain [Gelidibacter algens]|uniref:Outer membrane protein with beta-barrel domain n=1 Tax=Gelidibacter algens TaxID=49280 RepID=A0A327SB90_9FLAO|nr:outer membrane beta-barrel protein [Gelidibacter algens]RAJ25915.1 outer membrane protein with beta-barrel domain [Gelidibacter algens]
MRMIPKALIVCVLASTTYLTQAQNDIVSDDSNFYIRVSTGYSFESGKTEFNNADPNGLTGIMQSTDITVSADGSNVNVKSLNGTVGAGIKVNVTGGYMFNPYIGAEMGISYFHGDKTMIGRLRSPQVTSEENTYLRGFDVAPGIILTPNFKKVNPYARMGLIVPIAGDLTIETMARQTNGGGQGTDIMVEAKSEVKSKFSVGYFGALGLNYPVSDNLSIFGEVEIKNLSIKSKSAEITEYSTTAITDGQSQLVPGQQLADLPVYEKQFEFSDDYSQSTTTQPNQDAPRQIPTQFVNASGIGVNVGIRFTL